MRITLHRKISDSLVLIRFATVGVTILMPALGAMAVTRYLSLPELVGVIALGLSWHIFAHVSNDVVDLELDKRQPDRSDSPLVAGRVKKWHAAALALAQIPISILITLWLNPSALALAALVPAFVFMGIYNVWGKTIRFSLLTDFIQACSWASLSLWGAGIALRFPNALDVTNVTLFGYLVAFILMASGVHGTVRDLPNDLHHGKKTTAMLFGSKPNNQGGVSLPLGLKVYGAFIQLWLNTCILLPLLGNWFHYNSTALTVTLGLELLLIFCSWYLLARFPGVINNFPKLYQTGLLHLLVSYLSLLVLFTFYIGLPQLLLFLAFIILPLFTIDSQRESLKSPATSEQGNPGNAVPHA